jgi:hypothetical protein
LGGIEAHGKERMEEPIMTEVNSNIRRGAGTKAELPKPIFYG